MHQPLSDSRGLSLKLILDSVPLGIVQLDEQRRYLWANPAFLQLVGYSLEELTGMSMLEITHPDDREDSFVASEKLRQPGFELHRLEKRYLRKDGQVVWALVRSRQVFNPEDGAFDLFTVVEDITELKKKGASGNRVGKGEAKGKTQSA